MDPNYHNINQAFSSIFSQLLQPEESAIASLLSNHSDGQSSGTPASVADAALHQPLVRSSPPLSVPSYPATPCIPPMSVANSHQSTAALSPLLLDPQSSAGGQSQDTAAAIPRGLSAYLQKSRNLASPNPHDESQQSSSSTTLQVDGAATSKTSPWRERRIGATNLAPPVSSSGNGYPTASSSLANTPSGHERNGSGSGKDGKRGTSTLLLSCMSNRHQVKVYLNCRSLKKTNLYLVNQKPSDFHSVLFEPAFRVFDAWYIRRPSLNDRNCGSVNPGKTCQ